MVGVKLKLKRMLGNGSLLEAGEDITPEDEASQEAVYPNEVKWLAAPKKFAAALEAALAGAHPEVTKIRADDAIRVECADENDFLSSLKILAKLMPLSKASDENPLVKPN